ncbi:MAG TPA: serine O-acetyltransferase [Candidatus Methylacidiphilales bacterium]|nr:serine O-acetyltransferase [Candidatus Methylacidiphilales bacterium]
MDQELSRLAQQLCESYAKCGGINHIEGANLPSKRAVENLTQELLHLIFPGYMEERPLGNQEIRDVTRNRLVRIHDQLSIELEKSLDYRPIEGKEAGRTAMNFLRNLVGVRHMLQTDAAAALEGDPAAVSADEVMLAYPGVMAIAVQRMAHLLYKEKIALLPRMMTEWAHSLTGIDIHPGASIDTYFFIDHGTGVVIGETCTIGKHVRIYQGVTLGALSISKHVKRDNTGAALSGKRHPTIGNDVTIYAGATILGGDTVIGDRCVIGGNVWLTDSVSADHVVTFEAQQMSIRPRQRSAALDWQI